MGRKTRYIRMSFTHEEWLKQREFGIGASEAAAALGLNKYETPYKLWRRKLHLDPPAEESAAMIQGHVQEPYIANLFHNELGYEIIKSSVGDWLAIDPKYPFLRVSPDWTYWAGETKNESNKEVLECKSSLTNDRTPDCLKSDCIYWFIQVQYQMHVLGYRHCHLGFLHIQSNHHWFESIDYNETYTKEHIINPLISIWKNNYEPALRLLDEWKPFRHEDGTYLLSQSQYELLHEYAPASATGDDVVTKHPKQHDGKTLNGDVMFVDADDVGRFGLDPSKSSIRDIIEVYKSKSSRCKELDDDCKMIADYLKVRIGDAEAIEIDGAVAATFRASKPSVRFDSKAFEKDNPSLYESYLREAPGTRRLLVK